MIDGHTIPCNNEFYTKLDIILLTIVVISQLFDIFAISCCCAMFSAQR